MRLVLGDHDLLLGPGEVAEFDTRVPHRFGSTGKEPAEVLSLFVPQGERVHTHGRSGALNGRGQNVMTTLPGAWPCSW
jgi:mannose-6-phosphate isomerase-like protein (cupin superfamily)